MLETHLRRFGTLALPIAIGGIAGMLLAELLPGVRDYVPYLGLAFIVMVLALAFHPWRAAYRAWFVSIIVPSLALVGFSVVLPRPWNFIAVLAGSLLCVLLTCSSTARGWWWVHILRHRRPPPEVAFLWQLNGDVVEWSETLARDKGPLRPETREAAVEVIARIRGRAAPSDDLAALRDDYADVADRWMATPRELSQAQAYADLRDELDHLHGRLRAAADALRDQAPADQSA